MHNCRFFELRWKKPMKMMNSIIMTGFGRISAACGCHTGRRRKNNEDNFFFAGRYMASDNNGLGSILEKSFSLKKDRFFAVFDGMGGGEYGEIASYIAAKATEQYLNAEEAANLAGKKDYLEKMCTHVNDRIFKETLRLNAEMMGSTLAGLYFTGSQVWTVNVGDSRCFLLRDGKLQQISEDQTDEAYMKENGIHGRKPYLTQYMGMDPEEVRVLPYADCLQLKKGDRFLICSDGVSDMVSIEFLETMLLQTQSPAKCVDTILAATLEAGGKLEYYVQDREEWTEYSYGFDGLDLILSKDGKSTRLKSFSMLYAEKKNEGIYEWGYAENSTAGYDGIVHITMSTEEGYDSSIEWADGKRAENVTAQIEGNQFALTWDSTYRYDYDLGESEEGEGGKLTGIFLLTARPNGGADGGLSICVDGEWYPYVYDSTAYWNGELSDNLATDADVSSMSEQELGELKENQTAVSSGLMGAFKEQGLDSAKIDESTGTVQMDNNVLFALDKSKLTDEGKAYLDQFLAAYVPVISGAIEEGKVSTIVVEGYTDSAGDEAYNLKLSEERAQTVADYIKAGYPELANVIEVVGNGENNLILDGEGKEDAAASRRVEVRYVLKTE